MGSLLDQYHRQYMSGRTRMLWMPFLRQIGCSADGAGRIPGARLEREHIDSPDQINLGESGAWTVTGMLF